MLRRLIGLATAAVAVIAMSGAATATPAPSTAARPPVVQIIGAVEQKQRLTIADLAALPQQSITVSFQSGTGPQTHTYTGPLLLDVLTQAKPTFDPQIKNDKLRYAVTATGSDGYQALVAWAE